MFDAATIIPIIVEMICGAAGGMAVAHSAGSLRLTNGGSALTGAIGGLVLTWLAGRIPGINRLVGHVEQAVDAAVVGAGGLSPAVIVGVGISGLLGGVLLTILVGLARKNASTG